MASLSPLGYKGTRDYYPEDKRVQNYIFATWKQVVERHGYQEYGAPLLEPLDVYAAKSGQEIASEQTYSFVDRGDRVVAIRPEMTPSISRMVAARRQEMGYPARLFSIANFMRYERPQRGREREFWQLNADIFGVDGVLADAEIIGLAYEIMNAFGAKDDMYVIRVNNRDLINHMMASYLELDSAQSQSMIKLLDRKEKISIEEFATQASAIFTPDQAEQGLRKLGQLVSAQTIEDLPSELHDVSAVKEIMDLFEKLKFAGVTNAKFDVTLMRGFDYYTGMVFEVFDLHPDNNRAMFGGGRYDGLVGLFGAEPIPTVGFAPGLTTTELFLRSHGLLPKLPSTTEIGIVVIDDSVTAALDVARQLRSEGVNVEVDISGRKFDKQLKAVIKKDIPYIVFVGSDEVRDQLYTFKDTSTTDEEKLSIARIVSQVKDHRHKLADEDDELFG
ncbi:MAG: hisS [Candidatus Saccharibacteria bacterium]|nr:hisS [Candidatus Saccharibacteria bacterium]